MFSRVRHGLSAVLTIGLILLLALPSVSLAAENEVDLRGHYLSFDRARNLKTELTDLLERPETGTRYRVGLARDLDDALRTPGIRGIWMELAWGEFEVADGEYDWTLFDANMDVARAYGLVFIVNIADRSFSGNQLLPDWFPDQYVLASAGGGKHGYVSKRWDPWVYNRFIRMYKAIANRYADHEGFGGIATSETATGNFEGETDYSLEAYQHALAEIVTQTQAALKRGKLFLYLNFLKGGDKSNMNEDARVALLRDVPHDDLVIGAPDITPDVRGMVRSATPYRIHARKTMPSLDQFCHLQNVDQGLGGINVKSNEARIDYLNEVNAVRERETQSWFKDEPAVFEFDDLRDDEGGRIDLHPPSELGKLWPPEELFQFGRRNFDCDYFFWHYREWPKEDEFTWPELQDVISRNPCFYLPDGCESVEQVGMPTPPNLW